MEKLLKKRNRRTQIELAAAAAADPELAARRAAYKVAWLKRKDADYFQGLTDADLVKEAKWQVFLERLAAYRKQRGQTD